MTKYFSYDFDEQQAFDYVAQFMFDQNARAIQELDLGTGINGCMYRTKDGKKCAWGCLLPDEAIEEKRTFLSDLKDGYQYEGMLASKDSIEKHTPKLTVDFVRHLQSAHDGADDGEYFRTTFYVNMTRVAHYYKLNLDKLREIYKEYIIAVKTD